MIFTVILGVWAQVRNEIFPIRVFADRLEPEGFSQGDEFNARDWEERVHNCSKLPS